MIHPITLDDLDDDDKAALMSGSMQILPSKDNGGRTVLFLNRRYDSFKSWKNQVSVVNICADGDENMEGKHTHFSSFAFFAFVFNLCVVLYGTRAHESSEWFGI